MFYPLDHYHVSRLHYNSGSLAQYCMCLFNRFRHLNSQTSYIIQLLIQHQRETDWVIKVRWVLDVLYLSVHHRNTWREQNHFAIMMHSLVPEWRDYESSGWMSSLSSATFQRYRQILAVTRCNENDAYSTNTALHLHSFDVTVDKSFTQRGYEALLQSRTRESCI